MCLHFVLTVGTHNMQCFCWLIWSKEGRRLKMCFAPKCLLIRTNLCVCVIAESFILYHEGCKRFICWMLCPSHSTHRHVMLVLPLCQVMSCIAFVPGYCWNTGYMGAFFLVFDVEAVMHCVVRFPCSFLGKCVVVLNRAIPDSVCTEKELQSQNMLSIRSNCWASLTTEGGGNMNWVTGCIHMPFNNSLYLVLCTMF